MATDGTISKQQRFFNYGVPALILALAALVGLGFWFWPDPEMERSRRVFTLEVAVFLATGFLGIWFLFLPWSRWYVRLAIVAVLGLLARGSIREYHFNGDMEPVIDWIWSPTRDERLEAHRRQQTKLEPTAAKPADPAFDFPGYRGRNRDGIVTGPTLVRDWAKQPPRQIWRQPVGRGYAGFAVVGNSAVTIEQRREEEAVVCYNTATGGERWAHSYPASFTESLGGPGPRATPTIADGRVYSLGAMGHLVCLELATGNKVWTADILKSDSENVRWGMSGSPLVFDQMVVVNPGTQTADMANRALLALDRDSGKEIWAAGSHPTGYCSPMLVNLAGRRQIVIFDGNGLAGHDPASGKELWRYEWITMQGINVAQPIVLDGDRLFISSGYGVGCAMLKITESPKPTLVWDNKLMRCKFTSPVLHKGFLYGLDEGILVCLDSQTGERRWRDGRFGHGQLLLQDDLLVILSETGELALVEATPEQYRRLGGVQALKGRTWNYPALAGGRVYVRNDQEMACYDLTEPK
jgi:outer membrane protein assembly factor BamB